MTRSLLWGLILGLLLTAGPCRSQLEENTLDEGDDAETAPLERKDDPQLIDEVLNSDYFGNDNDAPPSPINGNDAPLPVEPSVAEEEEVSTQKPFCVGCPIEIDVEDPKVKEMAVFAFNSHLSGFKALEQAQRMVRVVNAMRQVVAGQKFILDLEVCDSYAKNHKY